VSNTSLVHPCLYSHWRVDSFPATFPGVVQLGEDFPLLSLSTAGEDALVNPPQYIPLFSYCICTSSFEFIITD